MNSYKKNIHIYLSLVAILLSVFCIVFAKPKKPQNSFSAVIPTPTIFEPFPYKIPEVPNSRSYLTLLVGDSMVEALGPNAPLLRQHLIEYYPSHEFVNYNYGFGATSIETLPQRLNEQTSYKGESYQPILSSGFDLIIIESFAYNPLSQLSAGEGLIKHKQILDASIRRIIKTRPNSVVAIMVTIAPSKKYFAKGVYELSSEERLKWTEERISYMESTIKYAKENKIPLINVYEKSLTPQGEADLKYISKTDYIHPSAEGVDLISKTIAEFIFTNKIFPE